MRSVFWLVLLLSVLGCGHLVASSAEPKSLSLIYTGNLDGELEPCGCSLEGNLGGILRQVSTIDAWREQNPGLFFISSGGLTVSQTAHDKSTGEYILKAYEQIGVDAVGVQWSDRAFGDDFISGYEVPWVSSNSAGVFATKREISRDNVDLAIYSWLDPSEMKKMSGMVELDEQAKAIAWLKAEFAQAKKNNKTTVLLSTLSLDQAQTLFPLDEVDILLIEFSYEVYGEPLKIGKTLVLQPGSRGMRFAKVDAELDAQGSIVSYEHLVKSMPPEVADAPRMLDWYDAYTEKLKQDYQASVALKKQRAAEGSPYAGAKACKSCHTDAYAKWKSSRHAKAYRTLEKVNKAFDSSCVSCHVVGFEKPGGFIDIELTRGLANVQCESCHGAASDHVESGGVKSVANHGWESAQMCSQCHIQKHSPSFQFETYWKNIAH